MSDDIVARLLICAKYDPDQKDAADEITRLRAELAAAKAELAATRAALQYARNLIGPDEIIDAALKGNE